MPLRKALHRVAPEFRRLSLLVCLAVFLLPLAAEARSAPSVDPGYVRALAAADHFLQAWQLGDLESGMVLLTGHAKEVATSDEVERFFSNPGRSAYEIERGKSLKRGRYEFPVVLVGSVEKGIHTRRRFASIIVVNTGNNDWAVDKLP